MKKLILFSLLFASTTQVWASCQSDAIVYRRDTSFSISLGGKKSGSQFSTQSTMNLPVFIDGRPACFKKTDAVSFEVQKSKKQNSIKFLMTPVIAEFENVPNGRVVQYFDFQHHGGYSSEVHVLTYICSGEIPLSKESYSDTILGLSMNSQGQTMRSSNVFATGAAARNLQQHRPVSNKTERHFSRLFALNNHGVSVESAPGNIFIPTVISDLSIQGSGAVDRRLYSTFDSQHRSSFNGCSEEFKQLMSPYLLDQVLEKGGVNEIQIRLKKKNQYELTIEL